MTSWFRLYKKDGVCPPGIDLDRATLGFNIDNTAAFQAIEDSKALHARRWQTKEGTYRIKRRALPDVRDEPLQDVNAAASCSVSPSSHLAFHIPTLAGFCLLFVLCCCLVLLLWFFVCLLLGCVFGSCFASVSESRILRAV